LLRVVVLEDIILRHIDDRKGIVIKDHTVSIQLLNWLHTLAITVSEFLLIGVTGDCWELEHPLFFCHYKMIFVTMLILTVSVLYSLFLYIKRESDEICLIEPLRLLMIRHVYQWYHRN